MKLFESTMMTKGKVTGIRINFLWIFTISITYNVANGSHINIGFGITPFEIAIQFSIWKLGRT